MECNTIIDKIILMIEELAKRHEQNGIILSKKRIMVLYFMAVAFQRLTSLAPCTAALRDSGKQVRRVRLIKCPFFRTPVSRVAVREFYCPPLLKRRH